jgi:thiol:disulfide interchange protein DsbD
MGKLMRQCLLAAVLLFALTAVGQDLPGVSFSFDKSRINDKEVVVSIKANIPAGIKLYALQKNKNDVLYSSIAFDSVFNKYLTGKVDEKGTVRSEPDPAAGAAVNYFSDSVLWQQKLQVSNTDSLVLKGTLSYLYKEGEEYKPGEENFKFFIRPVPGRLTGTPGNDGMTKNRSLVWIFFAAFAGGLLALLTPCVYSMIPITVSFFTKRGKTRAEGIKNAVYYSLSIIIIFTLLGFLITLIFGPAALNNLATNWIANLIFFAIFLLFGISFLGAFEIALPASWGTRADKKAGMHNFAGIFFMALTLVLISFSCTGPIIGNLLVLAAQGSYYGPLVGMFAFSLALALPFALFAFFPSFLNKLGRAGGWMNALKVTLGFLELALALKFLSNADLVKGWRFLDRETFISLWIAIFIFLTLYLLGKLKFNHDDELPKNDFGVPHLKIPRLFFALATFSFAIYMVPGLWGAPLKAISAFVPPMGTQDFTSKPPAEAGQALSEGLEPTTGRISLPHPQKYYDVMKIYEPEVVVKYGMVTYFDYDEALEVSRKLKKPLMLDFTGINCVNCRKMEGQVWSDPKVMQRLKEDFVIVSLYVDVQNIDLPEGEQYFSKALDKKVETLGDKHADFQVTKFGANTQPYYFFLDGNENKLAPQGYGYDADIDKFIQLLDGVKNAYQKSITEK